MDVLLQASDAMRSPVSSASSEDSPVSSMSWLANPSLKKKKKRSWNNVEGATVRELKSRCRSVGLGVSGTKDELCGRLGNSRLQEKTRRLEKPVVKKQAEPLGIRMSSLPLHAGPARCGSLRVTVAAGQLNEAAARVQTITQSPKEFSSHTAMVIPRAPLAISLLRHENVFAAPALRPSPRCLSCDEPAEVFELNGQENPVDAHLKNVGVDVVAQLSNGRASSKAPLLRICRRGCLTYEIFFDDDELQRTVTLCDSASDTSL